MRRCGCKQTTLVLAALASLLVLGQTARAQTLKFSVGVLGKFTADGMLLQKVTTGTPADKSGLQSGDVITRIDGNPVRSQTDFVNAVNASGGQTTFTVKKGGAGKAVQVSLDLTGTGPGTTVPQITKYPVGMLGKFTPDGMLVQKVLAETPAIKGGLQNRDLILKVDGRLITNQDDFVAVVNSSGGQVVLVVKRGSDGRIVRVGLDLAGTNKQGPPAPYFLGVVGSFTPNGMLVTNAIPATPAARAGLEKGDLIFGINKVTITNQNDLFTVLYSSGGSVTLQIKKASGRIVVQDVDLTNYDLGVLGEFSKDGMTIGVVAPGTPAAYVGLQKGDMILRIDNRTVRSQKDFDRLIKNSGGSVSLIVQRVGGSPTRLQVDLTNNQLGAWCEPATDGMRLTSVVPGSPAEAIGLARGDTILKIDDHRTRTNAELANALRNAPGLVTLTVRKGDTRTIVKIDADLAR